MTNDKSYHLLDPLQVIIDKLDALRGELEVLKMLMHIKEKDEERVFCKEKDKECVFCAEEQPTRTREELLQELDYMLLTWSTLSDAHQHKPVTHFDHLSLIRLISSLFKAS